jgi:hypothetical protein
MKRVPLCLVPWFFAACTVDTPVVQGDDDRLGDELGAWCQSWCERIDECGGDSRVLCLDGCLELFSKFAGKGSVCRDAGLRVMDCVEAATCEELDNPSACHVADELLSCFEATGETVCRGGFNGPSCIVGFDECSDGSEYSLECLDQSDPPECRCVVSGLTTGRFTPSELDCPSAAEAIQICAWPMVYNGNVLPPPTLCEAGGGELSGPDAGDCSMHYVDCSDGRDYEVRCAGSVGNVVCACIVDGLMVGSYESPYGICPFVEDADDGRVAANAGCGFKLAP